jgi:hypothetical protein
MRSCHQGGDGRALGDARDCTPSGWWRFVILGLKWLFRPRSPGTTGLPEEPPPPQALGFDDLFGRNARGIAKAADDTPPPAGLSAYRFAHIISLGADCDVALQLRRVGWLKTPSVFDWLVTPWDSMMAVLEDGGARLARKTYPCHDGRGAACADYHLMYWHEFPRDAQFLVQVTESQTEQARLKLTHKMARMQAACEEAKPVLFIRSGIVTDAPSDRFAAGAVFPSDELDRCVTLIDRLHPGLRFILLCIDYVGQDRIEEAAPYDPRIVRYRMDVAATRGTSKAADRDWDALFAKIVYQPERAAQTIAEQLH